MPIDNREPVPARSGLSGFVDSLSRPPRGPWPDGAQHHGTRILILLLLALLTGVLFPQTSLTDLPPVLLGEVPEEDVIAVADFEVPRPVNEIQRDRERAAAAVIPIFRYDSTAVGTMRTRVATLLDRMDSAFAAGTSVDDSNMRLRSTLLSYSLPADADQFELLGRPQTRMALRSSLSTTIERDLTQGIAQLADVEKSLSEEIRILADGTDRLVASDSVPTTEQLWAAAARNLPAGTSGGLREFQRLIVTRLFAPTLVPDQEATDMARQTARNSVQTVTAQILAGERVIAAHERVHQDDIERLDAYITRMSNLGLLQAGPARYLRMAGSILLNALLLAVFGAMLTLYRPAIYGSFRAILLLSFLYVSVVIPAAVIASGSAPAVLIPIAFPALVAAVLWDGRVALALALIVAILLAAQSQLGDTSALVLLSAGGAAAALSVRVVHRRAHGLILGAVSATAYLVASIGLGLLFSWDAFTFATTFAWGAVNGVGCALIAIGLMPVFEAWTGITTDQTLLELGDLNGPLLKRLSLEASGTYAHSINVAHLAEAATRAIGANPLLARVGAYYHDIGKMAAPQYFVENQAGGRNPHDRLPPQDSVAIIRGHVVEGMRMAEQAKLPQCIRDFIPEHHGSQLIGFFFEKAKENAAEGVELDPADFSYPGPNPRSSETAVLMLADSVESAAKVLEEPSTESLREMVNRIVEGKINRGQLDNAPLTFNDLSLVREAFVGVLSGMYHQRLDYPLSAIGLTTARPTQEPASRNA